MTRLLFSACLAGGLACGQTALAPPQAGFIQDNNHSLRPVLGLAANFVLGDSLGEGVVSSAFSGSFGMVKTDTSILVLDGGAQILFSMDTDPGRALFAFSAAGTPAFAYLPQSRLFLRWASDHLETAQFDPRLNLDQIGGAVLAIASPGPDRLSLITRRDDGVWLVDLSTGAQFAIPSLRGPVLLRSDGSVLYSDDQGLVLLGTSDLQRVLRIDAPVVISSLEQMDKDWVHVTERDSSRHFAIRLIPGQEQIYQLPEPQVEPDPDPQQ